jgi:hypothetical protein
VELTKTFTGDHYARALESWAWIGLDGKAPAFTSLFGDVFLQSPDGWWYLDTIEGSLTRLWESREALADDLNSGEGQDRYLLGGLAMAAARRGLTLGPQDVYDLVPPPVLGGRLAVENIAVYDFVVAVNLAGQLHHQVRNLPPGTPITEVRLVGPE